MVDKDISLGGAGDLDLSIVGSQAKLLLTLQAPNAGLGLSATVGVGMSASLLLTKVFALIESVSPAGVVPIEDSVKTMIINAVSAL